MLEGVVSPLVAVSIILAILMPVWAFWLAMRINRHLYHISVALWQIRDALRTQEPHTATSEPRHIANSMFGR
jgi:hypothetical protein